MCERERERERVRVCVCERERERERENAIRSQFVHDLPNKVAQANKKHHLPIIKN